MIGAPELARVGRGKVLLAQGNNQWRVALGPQKGDSDWGASTTCAISALALLLAPDRRDLHRAELAHLNGLHRKKLSESCDAPGEVTSSAASSRSIAQ